MSLAHSPIFCPHPQILHKIVHFFNMANWNSEHGIFPRTERRYWISLEGKIKIVSPSLNSSSSLQLWPFKLALQMCLTEV